MKFKQMQINPKNLMQDNLFILRVPLLGEHMS